MSDHDIIQIDGFDAVIIDGVPRLLNKLAPDPIRRAAFPPHLKAAPVVPKDQWVELDRRALFGDQYILDQKSHGSCVGFSSAAALMRSRTLEGASFVRLSGAYTYSWINGGRDQGAIISDSVGSLMHYGTCTEELVGWNTIYRSQISASADAEAKRFRILEAYKVENFHELVSGLQLGFIGVGAVMVGNTFTRVNSEGVAGFDKGPGNHAVCFDGVKKLASGQWAIDLPNSWGFAFGVRGRCYVTERHIDSVYQDSYLIRAGTTDPQDPNNPPVAQ